MLQVEQNHCLTKETYSFLPRLWILCPNALVMALATTEAVTETLLSHWLTTSFTFDLATDAVA